MKRLSLVLLAALASCVHGDGGDRSVREAERRRRRVDPEERRRIYVSEAEDLLSVLRDAEADRSSPSSAPLRFEVEVDLPSESSDDEDLSGLRRLQLPNGASADPAEKPLSTLLLQLSAVPSAVTPRTTYNFRSVSFPTNGKDDRTDIASKLAVLADDPAGAGGFAALSVNADAGTVSGVQRGRSGSVRKLELALSGGEIVESPREAAAAHPGRKRVFLGQPLKRKRDSFACGVERKEEWDERALGVDLDGGDGGRRGVRGGRDQVHHHSHERDHGHDHSRRHEHLDARNLQNLFSPEQIAFKRPDPISSSDPRFQINLIVDIDAPFIANQGSPQKAIEYVNWLVTSANLIFEREAGARLEVAHIQEVAYFEPAENLRDGLQIMRERYDGDYPEGVTLRHALLGKYIGGGIAFIDGVCDGKYGVGLSSGLTGRVESLDDDAVYDLFIMVHELGHSLGSDHTFESNAYKPQVDTCQLDSCPKDLPLPNSATIMSYCDFCEGGLSNVALSLGGEWTGVHPKLEVENWKRSGAVEDSDVSKDPERVSHHIWKTLYGKGQCILRATEKPTSSPTDKSTDKPTSSPTDKPTDKPTSSPTEKPVAPPPTPPPATSSPTSKPTVDYGPFLLAPMTACEDACYLSSGIMFDVGLGPYAPEDIVLESIRFQYTEPRSANATVDLYKTFTGTYRDKVSYASQWAKVQSIRLGSSGDPGFKTAEFKLDPPVAVSSDSSFGFYLRASASVLRVGTGSNYNLDEHGAFIGPGSTVMDGIFGIGVEGYVFNVNVEYSLMSPPTGAPTSNPTTARPTTLVPTARSTTLVPTSKSPTTPPAVVSLFSQPTLFSPESYSSVEKPTPRPSTAAKAIETETKVIAVPDYWLSPSILCSTNCLASSGFMFNVKLNQGSDNIVISAIQFDHLKGSANSSVDLYTTLSGTLAGKQEVPGQWKKVATVSLPNAASTAAVAIDPPISLTNGTSRGFYLAATEGVLAVGFDSPYAADANGATLSDGNVVFGRFGTCYDGYYLNAKVGYTVEP